MIKEQTKTLSKSDAMPKDIASNTYLINETFLSVQGEGMMSGTLMVFVRFARCNLRCSMRNAGFDCDTDFQGYRELTLDQLVQEVAELWPHALKTNTADSQWILLTGGEPALQIDTELVETLHRQGWNIAVETNGTIKLPDNLEWVTVSPKSAEHTLRQRQSHELRIIRSQGQSLGEYPEGLGSVRRYISPSFQPDGTLRREDLQWVLDLINQNPTYRLSIQLHKLLGAR